jgi:hypothetical protein
MSKYVSMNLTEEYVKGKGISFAITETAANFMDAGAHEIHLMRGEAVSFVSDSDPGIDKLLVIGAGTDREDKIGRFHEGNKLAALIATRTREASMVIESPRCRITFVFKKPAGFETRVLHACIDTDIKSERFIVTIYHTKAVEAYEEMILPAEQRSVVMLKKSSQNEYTRLYNQGILIDKFPEFKSRYHWNFGPGKIELNRDRSIPNMWNVRSAIRSHLDCNMTQELATELLRHPETEEARAVGECSYLYQRTKDTMKAAFHAIHGEKAVIQSEKSYTNIRAEGKGLIPVPLADVFREAFSRVVPTADEAVTQSDLLTRVNNPTHEPYLAEVARVMDILDIPAEVRVFEDRDDGTNGHAEWSGDGKLAIIWLNERLMAPGHRTERIRVAIHELAHVDGKAGDESHQFEMSLDSIAAKLAIKLL